MRDKKCEIKIRDKKMRDKKCEIKMRDKKNAR